MTLKKPRHRFSQLISFFIKSDQLYIFPIDKIRNILAIVQWKMLLLFCMSYIFTVWMIIWSTCHNLWLTNTKRMVLFTLEARAPDVIYFSHYKIIYPLPSNKLIGSGCIFFYCEKIYHDRCLWYEARCNCGSMFCG